MKRRRGENGDTIESSENNKDEARRIIDASDSASTVTSTSTEGLPPPLKRIKTEPNVDPTPVDVPPVLTHPPSTPMPPTLSTLPP